MKQKREPNWWFVFLAVPVMSGLLILESHLAISPDVHQILEYGIVLFGFGWMAVWVRLNEGALQEEEMAREAWRIRPEPGLDLDLDPRSLPLAQATEDSDQGQPDLVPGPTKGRYN